MIKVRPASYYKIYSKHECQSVPKFVARAKFLHARKCENVSSYKTELTFKLLVKQLVLGQILILSYLILTIAGSCLTFPV